MLSTRRPSSRKRLMSMRVSRGVRDFVLDQLAGLDGLRARPMFGGVGLYAGEIFFGIVAADVLYLRVDEATRATYEAAGSRPFTPYPDRAMTMAYYAVPVDVLESAPVLIEWARRAVTAAHAQGPKPRARPKPKAWSPEPISARRPARRR